MFYSRPEDCGSEEADSIAGLQVSPQFSQSLWRIHTWISIIPWTGSTSNITNFIYQKTVDTETFIITTIADNINSAVHLDY